MKIDDVSKKILREAKQIVIALKSPTRLAIALLLFNSNKPLFFSEIEKYILKDATIYSTFFYHIKKLQENGFLIHKSLEPPEVDGDTGKARYSLYELSDKGRRRINELIKLSEKIEEKT